MPLTLLCIATYRKGDEFLRECKRQGCRVLLLTEEKLRDADWPREAIDAFYYLRRDMPLDDVRKGAEDPEDFEREGSKIYRLVLGLSLEQDSVQLGGNVEGVTRWFDRISATDRAATPIASAH